jgi:hypothetical protein
MDGMKRIQDLQAGMAGRNLSALLIGYSRNILYYTGTAQPSWLLVLPGDCTL